MSQLHGASIYSMNPNCLGVSLSLHFFLFLLASSGICSQDDHCSTTADIQWFTGLPLEGATIDLLSSADSDAVFSVWWTILLDTLSPAGSEPWFPAWQSSMLRIRPRTPEQLLQNFLVADPVEILRQENPCGVYVFWIISKGVIFSNYIVMYPIQL